MTYSIWRREGGRGFFFWTLNDHLCLVFFRFFWVSLCFISTSLSLSLSLPKAAFLVDLCNSFISRFEAYPNTPYVHPCQVVVYVFVLIRLLSSPLVDHLSASALDQYYNVSLTTLTSSLHARVLTQKPIIIIHPTERCRRINGGDRNALPPLRIDNFPQASTYHPATPYPGP